MEMNTSEEITSAAVMALVDLANRMASRIVTVINPDLKDGDKSVAFQVAGSDLDFEIFTVPENQIKFYQDGMEIRQDDWFQRVNEAGE